MYNAGLQPVTVGSCDGTRDGTCDGSWGALVGMLVDVVGMLVEGVEYVTAKLGIALSIF